MQSIWTRAALGALAFAAVNSAADAQNSSSAPAAYSTPSVGAAVSLSGQDLSLLQDAIEAVKYGDNARADSDRNSISNPVARKLVQWALTDAAPNRLSFFQIEQARRDLWGWPRAEGRQEAAERALETSGLSPQQTVDWFEGQPPQTAEGAMALAAAYRTLGRTEDARKLISSTWRDGFFEADVQRTMLARFGDLLTQQDHIERMDSLLYGPQGPATQDLLPLLPADQQQLALARMAYRSGASNAPQLAAALPPSLAQSPGLAFEQARYLRSKGLDYQALRLVGNFPSAPDHPEGAKRIWTERWALFRLAMKDQDYRAAYNALANHGLPPSGDASEAEFYSGYLALVKLGDPQRALQHFTTMQQMTPSPINQAKSLFWQGRAREALGDSAGAQSAWSQAAQYSTTFYGQVSAEKVGITEINIGRDPVISAADRARFYGREQIQAAAMLMQVGERDLFRSFVLGINETLPNAEETALLVDFVRGYGDQDVSMKIVRAAASRRGFILPERGYPLRTPPAAGVDPAFILGITRQESGFDPNARSGAGAQGMMQLLPSTARAVATRMGLGYSPSMLTDPDYNMRLGSSYISQLADQFSGSYILAAAAYNAGPGRPNQWITTCGDPRTTTDPTDFIECVPIMETHDYIMRVMEGMQVYKARMNGGVATISPMADLKRGAYGMGPRPYVPTQASYTETSSASGLPSGPQPYAPAN